MRVSRVMLSVVVVLAVVSGAFALKLEPLPYANPAAAYSNARAVTVGPDGTVYIAGATKDTSATPANRATYWTQAGGSVNAPVILPTNTSGSTASQANGIGVLANGTLVVGANLTGGVSDWTNAAGQTENGWRVRMSGSGQATNGGQANQIVPISGNQYYNLGKNTSSADVGISYTIDGVTRTDTQDTWSMKHAGASTAAGTVQGISQTGVAVGELRSNETGSNIRRAYVHGSTGVIALPGIAGRTDARAQGYGISADGKVAVGLARWTDADAYEFPAYWTEDAPATWSSHKLGTLDSFTSSSVAFSANQDGSIIVGYAYPNSTRGECSVFWDRSVLDGNGLPKANLTKDYLASKGVDVSEWTELRRTYSAYTSAGGLTYIVGDGTWKADGLTRGFLVIIPEPATMSLLALGGLALLRRRSA